MKKILPALLMLLLTGCGNTGEIPGADMTGEISEIAETSSETEEQLPLPAGFPEFESITDEQVIALAYSDAPNADRIPDYYVPDFGGDYRIVWLSEDADAENPNPVPPERAQNYVIERTELIADTVLYLAYQVTYTENGQRTSEIQLFPKNFGMSGNDYAYYTGGTDEIAVLQNFDLIAKDQKILCRRFRDDPEIKCFIYDFYAVTVQDDGTAELGWYCYLIDREDQLVCTVPEWNQKRTVTLPGDVPQQTTEAAPSEDGLTYDIWLRSSNTEILIGQDDAEIIWYAEIPAACSPETVYLMDADTGEIAAELFDEADYEKYGDTIKGDSVYNCRFSVNTDIDTDPDVSADICYHYYAEFAENGITHRSETVDIRVLEPFTDKELEDMEVVDDAVSALMESADYQKLSDAEKRDQIAALLQKLAANGTANYPYSLIVPGSILIEDDLISFQYACGVSGGVQITAFRDMVN